MYLYLKFGPSPGHLKVIYNVSIDEDCEPLVNGKLIKVDTQVESNRSNAIDAICWFKSLTMEAVYIDCCARDARWCPKPILIRDSMIQVQLRRQDGTGKVDTVLIQDRQEPEPRTRNQIFIPESARPLFHDSAGMLDFHPIIDEMFECVERLYPKWDTLDHSGLLNEEIARILHCYVFPAVTFLKEDVPALEQCLRLIKIKHEAVGKDIVRRERSIDITDKYLDRLKEVIITNDEITTQAYLQACHTDFIDMFYVYLTKDIQSKNMKLEILQSKVNDMKRKTELDSDTLDELKKDRNAMHESVQKLLLVREAIRNHLYRPFLPKKKWKTHKKRIDEREASLHTNFQTVHKQLVEDKDQLKQICYRKLHLTSVREAVESTIKSLQHEHPTSLGDFTEFSIYLDSDNTSENPWKSMQDKVDEWMAQESSLHTLHVQGCEKIRELAESIVNDYQIVNVSDEELQATRSLCLGQGGQHFFPCLDEENQQDCHSKEDISSDRAPMVKVIVKQALRHVWSAAEEIAVSLDLDASPDSRHINRAWMCYGPYFWKDIGESVEKVYAYHYASKAREVHQRASSAAIADVMDSHFFQQMLGKGVTREADDEEREAVGELRSDSALSLDLQRCSVADLYVLANRCGARSSCLVHGDGATTSESCLTSRDGAKVSSHLMDLETFMSCSSANSHGSEPDEDKNKLAQRSQDLVKSMSCGPVHHSHNQEHNKDGQSCQSNGTVLTTLDRNRDQNQHLDCASSTPGSGVSASDCQRSDQTRGPPCVDISASVWSDQPRGNLGAGVNVPDCQRSDQSRGTLGTGVGVTVSASDCQRSDHPRGSPGADISTSDWSDHPTGNVGAGVSVNASDSQKPDHPGGPVGAGICASDCQRSDQPRGKPSVRSSHTLSSVLGVFDSVVDPYHHKVQQVLKAPDIMEKLRAVWRSVDFLNKKTEEVCKGKGMDALMPMSIFATSSFSEELFVDYFVQLLVLLDFKPSFALHSIYDFSLANAISTYMYLFDDKFSAPDDSSDYESV